MCVSPAVTQFLLFTSFCSLWHVTDMQVTGQHLVPMTIQKQNVITAVLADLLSFAEVWYIRCTAVNQASPHPGQNVSSAFISFVVQQDASALSVGQVNSLYAMAALVLGLICVYQGLRSHRLPPETWYLC